MDFSEKNPAFRIKYASTVLAASLFKRFDSLSHIIATVTIWIHNVFTAENTTRKKAKYIILETSLQLQAKHATF